MSTQSCWSRVRVALGVALVAGVLSACSATARAPAYLDTAARTMRPPAGHALVYVLRPAFLGKAVRFDVMANGTWIGATGGNRYIFTVLRPGHYLFQSKAENIASVRLTVYAGQVYYVEQRPRMGIVMARNDLVLLPPAVGRARLRRCFLSKDMPPRVLRLAAMVRRYGAPPASTAPPADTAPPDTTTAPPTAPEGSGGSGNDSAPPAAPDDTSATPPTGSSGGSGTPAP